MSIRNPRPFKASLDGEITLNFGMPIRDLQITNMSGSAILKWKFKESQDFAELEPTEIITLEDISNTELILQASNGSYRVLGIG